MIDVTSRSRSLSAGELESVGNHALAAAAGEDAGLDAHFLGEAGVLKAANVGVLALGVLPDNDHVDVARGLAAQRRLHAWVEHAGAFADVLVERAANRQQQAVERNVVLYVGVADRSQIDGVRLGQPIERVRGHHLAVLEVVIGAPRMLDEVPVYLEQPAHGPQDFETLLDHLHADAVATYHSDVVTGHVKPPQGMGQV